MEKFTDRLKFLKNINLFRDSSDSEMLEKQVNVLYGILGNLYGSKNLVVMASKKGILEELQSKEINKKVGALLKIIYEKEEIKEIQNEIDLVAGIERIEIKVADLLAVKTIEAEINKKVSDTMEKKHKEYLKEIKKKVITDEIGTENEHTEKKYAYLEKLEGKKELKTVMEILRPKNIKEIVGQEKAVKALLTKLGTPYPQHVILYGPPGVGKTTAARIALDEIKNIKYTPFEDEAPFIEVDGTTLRWDPRDMSNPLTGSVHDPIYQGAQKDFAGDGIPEPKLGLVTDAHGGILFIDEIGEMDIKYQSKLLKVLEDKRVNFESAYYDSENPKVPRYIKRLFEKGAPADFILIGATTRSPQDINPAIRSRVSEIYFEPLNKENIKQIIKNAAEKLEINIDNKALSLISQYTIEGRKAINILADIYSSKLYEANKNGDTKEIIINSKDVIKTVKMNRLRIFSEIKAKSEKEIGKTFGLGVSGFLGSVIEFEGDKFVNEDGKGTIRFNDTAGSMTKDSVFNSLTVAKKYTNKEVKNFDIHVNVIGGGKIDGPSAGAAITSMIISIINEMPLRQDIALTGEISIQGKIRPVGGISEKIYGAIQAGMKKVLIPEENRDDVPENIDEIEVVIVKTIEDVIKQLT